MLIKYLDFANNNVYTFILHDGRTTNRQQDMSMHHAVYTVHYYINIAVWSFTVDGLKYWHKATGDDSTTPVPGRWRAPYQRARSVDIEMTAYALLTYTHHQDFSGAVPIAKWLVSQRNSLGGFSSTQVNDIVLLLHSILSSWKNNSSWKLGGNFTVVICVKTPKRITELIRVINVWNNLPASIDFSFKCTVKLIDVCVFVRCFRF